MPRKPAPREANSDPGPTEVDGYDADGTPDVDAMMNAYDWDSDSLVCELWREAPDFHANKRVGGIQATFPHKLSVEDIRQKFGGGRFALKIKRDGKVLRHMRGIRIPGEPLYTYGAAAVQFETETAEPGGNGNASNLTTMLLQNHMRREQKLERRLEEADEILRERSTQATTSPDAAAFAALREANREAIESQRAWMQQLQHARDGADNRMSELFQAFLAAQGAQRSGRSADPEVYQATIEALKEEARSARQEHSNQLRAIQEQSREQVASADRHATMMVENLRAQFETQVQILQTANASRVQSLETQNTALTGELQQARVESNQLRDKIAELRAAVSEAKIEASKGGDGLSQLAKLSETAEAIKKVAGSLGIKSVDAPPDFKDRLLEVAQSGLPERVIGSLASAFRGPAVKAKAQAEGLRPPTQADHSAWAQWRQATTPAPPAPQEKKETKPPKPPPRPPSVVSLEKDDNITDPEDQEQLLRYLARRLEESAGITRPQELADELWRKVSAANLEEYVKEISAGQVIVAMDAIGLGLSFAARRQLRDVMSIIHSMPSVPVQDDESEDQ